MPTINAIDSNIPIEISKGGTNATSMANTDGVCYFDGTRVNTTTVGSANQLLMSNGSGNAPTFQNISSTFQINIQEFTTNGTYTPSAGMAYCIIEVYGGGGAGGGVTSTLPSTYSVGGGGGAGGYARGQFSATTIGASQAVTVPVAATGVSGSNGNNGGTCSLGALISATGGTGGTYGGSSTTVYGAGGAGGLGSGGQTNTYGAQGGWGWAAAATGIYFYISGGGASTPVGQGGAYVEVTHTVGGVGTGYGSGGAGSLNLTSQGNALAGGNGAPGIVIITEYIFSSTTLTYPVTVSNGGTGVAALAADGVLYGNGTSAVGVTSVGTANYALVSNGIGNAPTFQQVSMTSGVTGILPIANGGTNASSMGTSNGIVNFDGTRLVTSSTALLTSNVYSNSSQPSFRAYLS